MTKRVVILAGSLLIVFAGVCVLVTKFSPAALPLVGARRDHSAAQLKIIRLGKADGYHDAVFLNSRDLLAVGYDGREPGGMFVSNDGGHSWTHRDLPIHDCVANRIYFLDSEHGWIVGCSGAVLFTNNLGASWEPLGKPADKDLTEVKFIDENIGFATSAANHACQIYKTVDGGKSWRKVYENSEGDGSAFDLATFGNDVVIVALNDEYLLRSQDGGNTWQKLSGLNGASSITFTKDGLAFVVGRKGSFFASKDQGKTWHRPTHFPANLTTYKWWSIAFADSKRGVAVAENGAIAVTYDGGESWAEANARTDEPLTRVRFMNGKGLVLGFHNIYEISF